MIVLEISGAHEQDSNFEYLPHVLQKSLRFSVQLAAAQAGIRRMSVHHIKRTASICFHTRLRSSNHVVLLPLMHERLSRTLSCSSWLLAKSMSESGRFVNKQNHAFGERRILISPLHHPCVAPWFESKWHIKHFFRLKTTTTKLYLAILQESVGLQYALKDLEIWSRQFPQRTYDDRVFYRRLKKPLRK